MTVVEISALKGTGIIESGRKSSQASQTRNTSAPVHKFAPEIEDVLEDIENMLDASIPEEQKRFYAIKLFERDDKIAQTMKVVPNVEEIIKKARRELRMMTPRVLSPMSVTDILLLLLARVTRKRQKDSFPHPIRLTGLLRTVYWRCRFSRWLCSLYIMFP